MCLFVCLFGFFFQISNLDNDNDYLPAFLFSSSIADYIEIYYHLQILMSQLVWPLEASKKAWWHSLKERKQKTVSYI